MTIPSAMSRIGCLVLAWAATASTVRADAPAASPQRAALAAVDALFQAMATHDVAAVRRLLMPGAGLVVLRPDGRVVMERDSEFLQALATKKGDWRERIWSPQVLVDGGLAQVWAPYDFHLDGKLSHCGVDSFSMIRDAGVWRIAGISYTVQTQGCAPGPLDATRP